MRSKGKVLVISCLAVLVGGYLVIGCCSQYLRKTSPLFNHFFQPPDFYLPLVQLPFSTSSVDKIYECSFRAKYPGSHSVEVIVTNPVEVMESYGAAFTAVITIKDEGGSVLLEEVVTPSYSPFWGINKSGIKLISFKVPDDVPMKTPLTAYVRMKVEDGSFEDKYGPLILRIVKMSDE